MRIDAPRAEHVSQLLPLWKDVFGAYGDFWESFLETAFSPEQCRCVFLREQVASALCWFRTECAGQKMAYLYAVVTDPRYRGQGLCRQLVADTHRLLTEAGYSGVLLVPAEEGLRTMYQKMGYQNCTSVSEFTCAATGETVSLRAIGAEEYARLRRQHLPKNSVLQEGESLAFLSRQVQFFAGEDFLMAAYTEEDVLHAVEYLGNVQAAPKITAALGCTRGEFQTPGATKPFAMFHPLQKDAVVPSYFGFAFD